MTKITIGIHVHAEPERLRATLAAIEAHTAPGFALVLLPDGADAATKAVLSDLGHITQLATDVPRGAPACFNRLAQNTTADMLMLVESGTIVAPGWLDKLRAALAADPRHGLACPSTNVAWNQLAAFPLGQGDDGSIARTAAEADRRFGESWRSLAPLWDVGDFCLAVRRAVIDAVGAADEHYGLGPCWEMDYAIRAVRAGFIAVWAMGAYVFRHPMTVRRLREEARLFEASRRRYQNKFCGLRLTGARTNYARHCRGEACRHFAPVPLPGAAPPPSAATPAETRALATVLELPLVSCIMPTKGRPEWLTQAILYFQRQNYPNCELVIVDAGNGNTPIPDDPRIRRHCIASPRSIGAMRNIACDAARGQVILHWDDDDWYGTDRIAAQVQPILDGRADVTGLNDTLFFDLDEWAFWRCTPELHRRMFVLDVHGGTLAFRKSLFGPGCRYPDYSLAEDAFFLRHAVHQGAKLLPIANQGLYVYLRHSDNAWRFRCGQFLDALGWRREDEPREFAGDRDFYAGQASAVSHAIAATPAAATPTVSLRPALVSCIMPTANRRRFVPAAIAQFLAQDFPAAELVILDDGEDAVGDLVPTHPTIRYLRTQRHRSLGAKRNDACEAAHGDIILHWDDDDWYAPHRVRYQVEALEAGNAELCGIDRALCFDPRLPAAWEYVYPPGGPPWVYGATLCYRRAFWRAHPFPDMNVGEDTCFAAAAQLRQVHTLPDNLFFVALVHAANTSPKHVRDPRWQPRPVEIIRALTGSNWPPPEAASDTAAVLPANRNRAPLPNKPFGITVSSVRQ